MFPLGVGVGGLIRLLQQKLAIVLIFKGLLVCLDLDAVGGGGG